MPEGELPQIPIREPGRLPPPTIRRIPGESIEIPDLPGIRKRREHPNPFDPKNPGIEECCGDFNGGLNSILEN